MTAPMTAPPEARHEDFLCRFSAVQPALRRFVLAHAPDPHGVEDLLQKVALILWRKFAEFDAGRSFTAWALGMARNEILHARRSSARDRLVLSDEVSRQIAERLTESELDVKGASLELCLEKLPERARAAIDLYYRQGLSTKKIAESGGGSVLAIRMLLFRARQALGRCLERTIGKEPA